MISMRIGVHDRKEIQNLLYWKRKYQKVLKAEKNKTNDCTDDRARGNCKNKLDKYV